MIFEVWNLTEQLVISLLVMHFSIEIYDGKLNVEIERGYKLENFDLILSTSKTLKGLLSTN